MTHRLTFHIEAVTHEEQRKVLRVLTALALQHDVAFTAVLGDSVYTAPMRDDVYARSDNVYAGKRCATYRAECIMPESDTRNPRSLASQLARAICDHTGEQCVMPVIDVVDAICTCDWHDAPKTRGSAAHRLTRP